MQHNNHFKVIDFFYKQLNENTLEYLQGISPTYRDQVLKEHIYGDLLEELPETGILNCIRVDLEDISHRMIKEDASYFRVVFS